MTVEPTTTAILAKAGVDIAKKAADNVALQFGRKITGLTRSASDQIAVSLRLGVQKYLETSYTKCRFFKTILSPNERLEVTKHYVHVSLTCGAEVVPDKKLIVGTDNQKSIVVTGLAGSGKSMFMKYLTVWHFENTREVTPLFVELRHLNNLTDRNLLTYIRTSCTSRHSVISETHFDAALRAGVFLIILDGFDELNHDIRQTTEKQILDLRKDFPGTGVIISSRPDERFGSWTEFRVFKVNELEKDQTVRLINFLPYDAGVKKRFLIDVVEKLYDTHRSFLCSPLLSTIMLLTFESFSEIPTKIHAFYGQAFDTLFQRHDAQKDQFKRQTYSGLQLEDFKSCFAAFCAMSYLQGRFSFDEKMLAETAESAVKYIEQTRAKTSKAKPKKFTAKQFTDDLHETVCMLQQDGLEVSFVHRSFQEYFAARFVTQLNSGRIAKIIDKYCRSQSDNVIPMLHDMYKEPVEIEWVIPTIDRIIDSIFVPGFENNSGVCFAHFFPTLEFFYIGVDRLICIPESFDMDNVAPVQMLCRLYPVNLGMNFIVKHLRAQTLHAKFSTIFRNELNRDKPRFLEFHDRIRHTPTTLRGRRERQPNLPLRWEITLKADDAWWLDEIGTSQMLQTLHTSLLAIRKDIQGRDRRRNSILEDFI